jgi:hypothetical protein
MVTMAPIYAGYAALMLRWLDGPARALGTVFSAFRGWRLLLNVTVAAALVQAALMVIEIITGWSPASWAWGILMPLVRDMPGTSWLVSGVAQCFEHLFTVPVAWAGLEALTAGRAWHAAIGRSLTLVVRHWPLALAYFLTVCAAMLGTSLANTLISRFARGSGLMVMLLTALGIWAFYLAVTTLALAVVYREMLRRDAPAAPVSAVVELG